MDGFVLLVANIERILFVNVNQFYLQDVRLLLLVDEIIDKNPVQIKIYIKKIYFKGK